MTLDQFAAACDLTSLGETDRACYLAFFYLKTKGTEEFSASDASSWLVAYGFSEPNRTRLDTRLRACRNTIKGRQGHRLSLAFTRELEAKFPALSHKSQDVVDDGTILPEIDYRSTRGYVESLAKQINASYEHNLFDGCAVLMRRLIEVLLILSYRKLQIESVIQDGAGNFHMLEVIIANAKNNTDLGLSRTSKPFLDVFRELGNFSAHRVEYTCRREYIAPHIQGYRALFVELLHKAGIRN
jgi:hypothetical protein